MTSEKNIHRLVLPSVRLSDAGEYTALAGSSMSIGHLSVEGRDVKITEPADRIVTVSPLLFLNTVRLGLSEFNQNLNRGTLFPLDIRSELWIDGAQQ